MQAFRQHFSKVISWLFLAVFLIIFFSVIFLDGGSFSIHNNYPVISLLLGADLAVIVIFLYCKFFSSKHKSRPLTIRSEIIIVASIFLVLFLLELGIIHLLQVQPDWDFGALYEAATTKVRTGNFGEWSAYLSNFPFQLFLVYMYVAYLNIVGSLFPAQFALMLLNAIFILGSIFLTYLSIRKLFGSKKALFALSLFLFFSPILLYAPIFYSDTISMFFVTASFYLLLWLLDQRLKLSTRIILSLLFSLTIFCGVQIKATSVILLIAIIIYLFLISKNHSRHFSQNFLIAAASLVIIFLPLNTMLSLVRSRALDSSQEIPKTHWVMMGLKEYGGWNGEDYNLVTLPALESGGDVAETHLKEIKSRLGNYGVFGYLGFLLKKTSFTWGDGTYYISEKLSRSPSHPDSLLYNTVAKDGKYFKFYQILQNSVQSMLLLLLVLGAFLTISRQDTFLVIKLSLLGLVAFLLIWETRSRYLVNYLPLMLILLTSFIDAISAKVRPKFSKYFKK